MEQHAVVDHQANMAGEEHKVAALGEASAALVAGIERGGGGCPSAGEPCDAAVDTDTDADADADADGGCGAA